MGAIAGLSFFDGRPVSETGVRRMLGKLGHRGGESEIWCRRSVGFGVRSRLGALSDSPDAALITSRAGRGRLVLACDTRLDDTEELRARLGAPGETRSDARLIIAAYEAWGESCVEYLAGDFAFAVWDEGERRLFCARDTHGVKAFFFFSEPPLFAFATEIRALHAFPDIRRRLNEERVADYLTLTVEDREATFFEGILRLLPGRTMTVSVSGRRTRGYWPPELLERVGHRDSADAISELRDTLDRSTRARLESAVSPGCLLSGGLDSSSVTCLAIRDRAERQSAPLRCYSAIFPSVPECDESRFIRDVASTGNLDLRLVPVDGKSPFVENEGLLQGLEEPVWAPNLFLNRALIEAARDDGVDVLLDGFDGNTTIPHGLGRLTELLWRARWRDLASEVRARARLSDDTIGRLILRRAFSPGIPNRMRSAWRWMLRRDERWGAIHPDFARRIGLAERQRFLQEPYRGRILSSRDEHLRRLRRGVTMYGFEILDKLGSLHGVDVRFPFANRHLAELCLSLPGDLFLRNGWDRWILRRAMEGLLPERVVWRSDKSDLSPAFRRAVLEFGPPYVEELLRDRPDAVAPYLDFDALKVICRRFVHRPINQDATHLWLAVSLALWLRADQG